MKQRKLSANILFAGMGCQEMALRKTFDLEVVSTSEIGRNVIILYSEIYHGLTEEMVRNYGAYPDRDVMVQELTDKNIGYDPEKKKPFDWARQKPELVQKTWLAVHLSRNLGDISRIQKLPYADLVTVSFPCTDISQAGKMKGLAPDSGTRSSLLWQQIELLKRSVEDGEPPKYILFENVKALVGKKFRKDFDDLLEILSDLGFNSYWKVLNSKNYGTPQNRERVFVFCIRKDIDNGSFTFPETVALKKNLDDIMDPGNGSQIRAINLLDQNIPNWRQRAAAMCNNDSSADMELTDHTDTYMTTEKPAGGRTRKPKQLHGQAINSDTGGQAYQNNGTSDNNTFTIPAISIMPAVSVL